MTPEVPKGHFWVLLKARIALLAHPGMFLRPAEAVCDFYEPQKASEKFLPFLQVDKVLTSSSLQRCCWLRDSCCGVFPWGGTHKTTAVSAPLYGENPEGTLKCHVTSLPWALNKPMDGISSQPIPWTFLRSILEAFALLLLISSIHLHQCAYIHAHVCICAHHKRN